MHNIGLKIAEINKDLALLPENRLDEVRNFVTFILSQNKDKKRKIVQMRGIWKGKGFEGLDIDKEIKAVRQEMSESILKREVWSMEYIADTVTVIRHFSETGKIGKNETNLEL